MKQAINDLLEGKELVKPDPFNNWQLVEQTLNETVQNQEERVTLFDLTGLKVELDDDYYLENEDFAEDSSSLATTDIQTEPDPMTWHPVVKNEFQENIEVPIPEPPPQISAENYAPTFQEPHGLWNPFPDPDAGLPNDLYQIHRNHWLRSQYQLWLQIVQENKELVEQYYFQK